MSLIVHPNDLLVNCLPPSPPLVNGMVMVIAGDTSKYRLCMMCIFISQEGSVLNRVIRKH